MDTDPTPTAPDTAAILQRILHAVEKDEGRKRSEVATAIVLSLATMASAWCAYQSTLWGGVQTTCMNDANRAERDAGEKIVAMHQYRSVDAIMFMFYAEARSRGDEQQTEFLHRRFRPPMRKAVDAWLATRPYEKGAPPTHPLMMADYVQVEEDEAKALSAKAADLTKTAHEAGGRSDSYVLLTVLFASVLFTGGIAGTVEAERPRLIMSVMTLVLFAATTVSLLMMPICWE